MSIKHRLINKKQEIDKKIHNLKVESEQVYAEKLRKKQDQFLEPGTIKHGLVNRMGVLDFIESCIERRRMIRENKKQK